MPKTETGAREERPNPLEDSARLPQLAVSDLLVKLSALIQRIDSLERRISLLEPSISSIESDELPEPPDRKKQKLLF